MIYQVGQGQEWDGEWGQDGMGWEWDGNKDGTGTDSDRTGQDGDRETKRMGTGTGSWTDMQTMECFKVLLSHY